jgi:PilZ domain-containing protein
MSEETLCGTRRYQPISLPNGMFVAWYGGGEQQVSRVKTLGMGGLFLSVSNAPPVGANVRLVFEVPGGSVQAEGVVMNIAPDEGMGVEFTRMVARDRILLERLLRRLLR